MAEARCEPRIRVRYQAVLMAVSGGAPTSYKGETLDISANGASFVCHYHVHSEDPCTFYMQVTPPSMGRPANVFEATCRIVNCVLSSQQGGFRHGLQFQKMSPQNRQVLQELTGIPKAKPTLM